MLDWLKRKFERFMMDIRKYTTIGVVLCIVAGIGQIVTNDVGKNEIAQNVVMILVLIILLGIIIYFWYGKDHQCPACHKRFCIKKVEEKIIDREEISVLMKTKTNEQYVPGERVTFRVKEVCKKCGEEFYSIYKKDIPKL